VGIIQRIPRNPATGPSGYSVSGITSPSSANGNYYPDGTSGGKTEYSHESASYWLTYQELTLAAWTIYSSSGQMADPYLIEQDFASNDDGSAPDAGTWSCNGSWAGTPSVSAA
jgi:hypothetical protein